MNTNNKKSHPLKGRTMYIPRMSTEGASCMAAAFGSIGVDARISPPSDSNTLAFSAKFTTGEECLPQRIVLGNFLKIINDKDFNPEKNAFLLPTSSGPCRFGQYAPLMKKILKELKFADAVIYSPTSSDGYESIAENTISFLRTAWRAMIVSDMLRKIKLMFRPYEKNPGSTEKLHSRALSCICNILRDESHSSALELKQLINALQEIRDQYLELPLKEPLYSRPLIGITGEIFLRFNRYGNQDILKKLESLGAETWIADIAEWVWYTNIEEKRKLREAGKKSSFAMLKAHLRHSIQHLDEKRLQKPFAGIFSQRQEARIETILQYSMDYLPYAQSHGEMTLNAGKAVDFYRSGCDGIIDISPFTCMNAIVSEVIYPRLSKDHDNIPIRIFYFDGVPVDLERDLEIFMEQVLSYRKRKKSKFDFRQD
ncbi:MAG: hypothetical protein R6V04_03735 [bacterium]